jgi:hypothetical protein
MQSTGFVQHGFLNINERETKKNIDCMHLQ